MKKEVTKAKSPLNGAVVIPSDKSISHRAVMFSSLAKGESRIENFSKGADCMSTLRVFKSLGVDAEFLDEKTLIVKSEGILEPSQKALDCGNSGTTMRLVSGILSGQNFDSILIGDESLSKRPMGRIINPLSIMGADISGEIKEKNGKEIITAPLNIKGHALSGIEFDSKLASAQVKSSVILAGLNAEGETKFIEPHLSRNHTELMLEYLGANLQTGKTEDGKSFVVVKKSQLEGKTITIPGDISSAAFFIVAGLIVPDSDIILKNVGLNPTRTGIIEVVKNMGGHVEILNQRIVSNESVGDLRIKYSKLSGCVIEGEIIPKLIDELPVIAVLASQAEGKTIVKNAEDLRNKESDRIKVVVDELKKLGANIEETPDGFIVLGNNNQGLLGGFEVETYHDHRLAMSLYVAGLVCKNSILINGFEWVNISFPEFADLMESLQ